jgi:hypothetical protein
MVRLSPALSRGCVDLWKVVSALDPQRSGGRGECTEKAEQVFALEKHVQGRSLRENGMVPN